MSDNLDRLSFCEALSKCSQLWLNVDYTPGFLLKPSGYWNVITASG